MMNKPALSGIATAAFLFGLSPMVVAQSPCPQPHVTLESGIAGLLGWAASCAQAIPVPQPSTSATWPWFGASPPAPAPPTRPSAVPPVAPAWSGAGTLAHLAVPPPVLSRNLPPQVLARFPPIERLRGNGRSYCGGIRFQQTELRLDCWTPTYGQVHGAYPYRSSRTRLGFVPGGNAELPASVDHRASGTEGKVRNQGTVGACTAFSMATAIDHELAQRTGAPGSVSAMHIWGRYHEPSMSAAVAANQGRSVTDESTLEWNFISAREACSWTTPCDFDTCIWKASSCGEPVEESWMHKADAHPVATVTAISSINADTRSFREALADGHDIWMSMHWSEDMDLEGTLYPVISVFSNGPFVLPDVDATGSDSAHAFVLSGYQTQTDGTYFLIHNSHGSWWGDDGYVWIHEKTLFRNVTSARSGYVLEVVPAK